MTHFVGNSKNKLPVHVDLINSNAAKRIAHHPYLLAVAAEALQHITLTKPIVNLEYDMGRNIGHDFVVETNASDNIFYVQLVRDRVYTRFIKNGTPLPTRYVSMTLARDQKSDPYHIQDVWVGRLAPPRPGSDEETPQSKTYWEGHAIVFGNEPIQSRTLTKTCPY
jgi:hypothetical protein